MNILQPGAGVGGHCIAVDPWFIVDKTPEQAPLIRMAREVNDGKPRWVLGQIRGAIDRKVAAGTPEDQVKVAVLGLAFKPNIDDLRESPALHIAEQLAGSTSARLLVVEPNVLALPRSLQDYPLVELEEALQGADVVAVLVAHKEFQGLREQLAPAQEVVDAVGISLERRKGS